MSTNETTTPPTLPLSHDEHDDLVVRPVGAWVVGGFLVFTIVLMWSLVSYIFSIRS